MKTDKIEHFLWKKKDSDAVLMYTLTNATTKSITYYSKNYGRSEFHKYAWRHDFDPLTDIKSSLKRHNYYFVCSLLIPSDHTKKDLTKYYDTIKKKLSL